MTLIKRHRRFVTSRDRPREFVDAARQVRFGSQTEAVRRGATALEYDERHLLAAH